MAVQDQLQDAEYFLRIIRSKDTIKTKWFFEDYPQREVPDVCHDLLEKMKDFVNKIHGKFPI